MMAPRRFLSAVLLALPLAAWSAAAETAAQPSLAISTMTPNNVDSSVARMVTDALGDELLRTGKFRVMERGQMEKVLAEQGFEQSGACNGEECAVRIGRLLGIDRIVLGSVGNLGSAYVVTAREVDVATGEVLVSASRVQKGEIEDLLIKLVPQIAKDLAGNPPHNPYVARQQKMERGSRAWVWWAGAGVAAAGGAAAFLLLSDDGSPESGTNQGVTKKSEFDLRW